MRATSNEQRATSNEQRATSNAFSLIELLVIVSIIGVIAAVAMPQYKKYIAKTKAIKIINNHVNHYLPIMKEYYVQHGRFPTSTLLGIKVPGFADAAPPLSGANAAYVRVGSNNKCGTLVVTILNTTLGVPAGVFDNGVGFTPKNMLIYQLAIYEKDGVFNVLCGTAGQPVSNYEYVPNNCKYTNFNLFDNTYPRFVTVSGGLCNGI